ncbi:MAG: 50S ribosomal protein L25 [Spirulinaceae cyanobacterium RM2_2_10]|nr:50S ribosomal protein L25 [Spirulinaceae cyanobacterium SM2_1_0]NJO19843.1 50S ribosomal protein L25 [Spirulinaceae cyanobacterium RM2_2_10]
MSATIECQKRPEGSKPRALRREGQLPATIYGHQGAESWSLVVNAKEAETLLRQIKINQTPVEVKIPDLDWSGQAVVREVQSHPWRRSLYHVSFFVIPPQDAAGA